MESHHHNLSYNPNLECNLCLHILYHLLKEFQNIFVSNSSRFNRVIKNRLKYRIILNQNFKVKMHNPKSCTTICNNLEVCTQWKPYKREYRIQESRLDILVYTFPIFNV